MLFTLPGAPCIYYGDEIGMAGTHDPGSRGGFPWDRSGEWHGETLDHHRSLTALRSAEPTLRWGGVEVAIGEGNTLGYIRHHEGDRLLVVLNAGDERQHSWCEVRAANAELIWGSGEARTSDGGVHVAVPGRSAGVWRLCD
ncbi:DUF3459 domain-containing protein [bacterium]|nr:DUF3459 domain-containing protein [bacterium]